MSLESQSKAANRRSEPRERAEGQVQLRPQGSPTRVPGEMVDITHSGFRARHKVRTLASGNIVEFAYSDLEGRARVVWTRIVNDYVESGFFILPRDN